MTPLQKAIRRFQAGRPPAIAKNSPLAAVSLVGLQRERLTRILSETAELSGAVVSLMGVVIVGSRDGVTHHGPGDFIPVVENHEDAAIATLREYGTHNIDFRVVGLMFTVRHDGKQLPAAYLLERTPEASAALIASFERQVSGKVAVPN